VNAIFWTNVCFRRLRTFRCTRSGLLEERALEVDHILPRAMMALTTSRTFRRSGAPQTTATCALFAHEWTTKCLSASCATLPTAQGRDGVEQLATVPDNTYAEVL
jgi:hypothetical protein